MASTADNLYVTYVDVDRDLLKLWAQRNRIGATYIERQLLQLLPKFNVRGSPNPDRIHKGMFCFAKYTDDNYYRARIISKVQNDSVGVLFVDYGNKDIINLSNIRVQEGNEGDVLAKMSEQAEEYYLAKIAAPPLGWTNEIISEIRRHICYDEFRYQIIGQIGDQKILDIQFRDEDFSAYLVKKQLARPMSLPVQKELILSYCSLVSNEVNPNEKFKESPKMIFPPAVPPPSLRVPLRPANLINEACMQQLNYAKANNSVPFSCPSPPVQYPSVQKIRATLHHLDQNIPKTSYCPPVHHISNQIPIETVPVQPINPILNPLLNQPPLNQFYQIQESSDSFNSNNNNSNSCSNNNNIIEILAQQVKHYIVKDNAKTETEEEKVPHHYVNNVLKVGYTYNIIISYIEDGPWSFSIQLMSSESDLQKLMKELASIELIPIKPPIILGHPCIACSALHENLCRGVVVSISRSAVKVYFVDFGNTEDLPSSSLYELPPIFFKTGVLSQKFSLSGLQKVVYSDDIKKCFKEVVQDEVLMLRVVTLEDDNLPTCELYLKQKNIKRILNEKMRELRSSALEDLPKVGDTEDVVVTWVVSPQKFFVQLRKRDAELKALKKELTEVETIGQRMTYQQLSVGFKCVCYYESDGNWYRAVITSVDSENEITVFYVDYGNTEIVNISNLRKIDGSGLINQMGNQAIQCSLKGFEDQPFDQELAHKLESLVLEKDFQMSVASSEKELLCVNLCKNGNNIASLLLLSQTQPKTNQSKTCIQNDRIDWDSGSTEFGIQSRSQREDNSQVDDSFEWKERNFCNDQTRKKTQGDGSVDNFQSYKSPAWSSQAPLKSRLEDRESWRNDNYRSEQKTDEQKSWRIRKFKENENWDSNTSAGNKVFFRGRSEWNDNARHENSKEFNNDKIRFDKDEKRTNNYGYKKSSGRRFDGDKKLDTKDGKRFEIVRGWNSSRGTEDSKKKFGDRNEKSDEWKSLRVHVRKEDTAPPGSKFSERIVDIGSCERGIVTYYFSPDEFFVQLLDQEEDFKKMMKDIQSFYSDKYSIRDTVKAGDVVIAQFSFDKILYRAEVIRASPVTVRYVDYGNQEPVQPNSIWILDKQFLKLPQQVVRCRLSGIQPIGSFWPPPGSEIDKFFEFAEYECLFLKKLGDIYEISMKAVGTEKDVASEIIAAGLGKSEMNFEISKIDYSLLPNQILYLYVSYVESSTKFFLRINPRATEKIEEILTAIIDAKTDLYPIDWSRIEQNMLCSVTTDDALWCRGNIIKVNGENVSIWLTDKGEKVTLTKDKVMGIPDFMKAIEPQVLECSLYGITSVMDEEYFRDHIEYRKHLVSIVSVTDKRLFVVLYDEKGRIYDFQKEAPETVDVIGELPIIYQKLPLYISHLESIKEVYIQTTDDENDLIEFSDQLKRFYSEGGETFQANEDISVGMFVAAKSVYYDAWYRARVVSILKGKLRVFFVDYGNTEVISRENVKRLDDSFKGLNAFCRGLPLDVEYDPKTSKKIKCQILKLCNDKDLVGYFKNNNGKLVLEFKIGGEKLEDLLQPEADEPDESVEDASTDERADSPAVSGWLSDNSVNSRVDFRGFVTHVDSPRCFWVHKETLMNELEDFQERLQKQCEMIPEKKDVKVNDVVAAQIMDVWYRGKVTSIHGNSVIMQIVDFGNHAVVDQTTEPLKSLPAELIEVPVFATCFALKGTFNDSGTAKFEEIILRSEDPVSVVVVEEKADPIIVDLIQNGRSMAEIMLEEGAGCELEENEEDLFTVCITYIVSPNDFYVQRKIFSATLDKITQGLSYAPNFKIPVSVEENKLYAAMFPEDEVWYRAKVISKKGNKIEVHFVDYGNTSAVTKIRLLPNDLLELPRLAENCSLLFSNFSDSWSEEACKRFAQFADRRELKMKVVVSGINKSIVKLFYQNKSLTKDLEPLCRTDGRTEMYVAYAVSPLDFYIQYVDDDQYKLIEKKLKKGDKCEVLEDRMVGALCQARFVDDGYWYRARITQNLGAEGCEVFFIDYGNTSVSTEFRELPPEIQNIPPRALKCRLNLDPDLSERVTEEFISLTAAGAAVFRGKILVPGETNVVSLKLDGRILEETLILKIDPEEYLDNGKESKNSNLSGRVGIPEKLDKKLKEKSFENAEEDVEEAKTNLMSWNEGMQLIEKSKEEENSEEVTPVESKHKKPSVSRVSEQNAMAFEDEVVDNLKKIRDDNKIIPGSNSRGEEEKAEEPLNPSYLKIKYSEKLVPGSISRGISLESVEKVIMEKGSVTEEMNGSQSFPNTPRPYRRSEYVKIDVSDRLVPGCISAGMPLHCSPAGEKPLQSERIVSGSVNGFEKKLNI